MKKNVFLLQLHTHYRKSNFAQDPYLFADFSILEKTYYVVYAKRVAYLIGFFFQLSSVNKQTFWICHVWVCCLLRMFYLNCSVLTNRSLFSCNKAAWATCLKTYCLIIAIKIKMCCTTCFQCMFSSVMINAWLRGKRFTGHINWTLFFLSLDLVRVFRIGLGFTLLCPAELKGFEKDSDWHIAQTKRGEKLCTLQHSK